MFNFQSAFLIQVFMAYTETIYKVDSENRIIEVSPGWDGFARQNNGEEVVSSCIVGRKLNEFIKGDSASMWIHSLITSARAKNKEMIRFYRCDSPDEKRYMKMTITPGEGGVVSVSSKLIRVEKMKKRVGFVYRPLSNNRKCSICNKIYFQQSWLEPDDANVLGLLDENNPISVVYTVCEACTVKAIPSP